MLLRNYLKKMRRASMSCGGTAKAGFLTGMVNDWPNGERHDKLLFRCLWQASK
jgi:hypothetical protein